MQPADAVRQQAGDIAQQARRVAALAYATNPPTPTHVVAEAVEELSREVAELHCRLRQERDR